MDKLDMFNGRFGKVEEFGQWYIERIQTDASTQFTSKEFKEYLSVRDTRLSLATPDHQEIINKVEVTQKILRTTTQSIMVNAWISDKYIHFH